MVNLRALSGFSRVRWALLAGAVVAAIPAGVLLHRWLPVLRVRLPPSIEAHTLAPYRSVRLDTEPEAIRIAGDVPPAGLYFTYRLNPEKRYVLSVAGQVLAGRPSLRVRLDEREPAWRQAPHGIGGHVVGHASRLEVLIYSDAAFAYRLRALAVTECADCRTDEDLKAQILSEQPRLQVLLRDDRLEAARELLRWVSPRIDFALTSSTDAVGDAQVADVSAADAYYRLFAASRAGVFCGGAALFTSRVLRLFGFDATTIDFGVPGSVLTHVAVVLADPAPGGPRFYVLDPTFNAMFRLPSGRFATLAEMVTAHREARFDDIAMDQSSLASRDWVCAEKGRGSCRLDARCEARVRTEGNRVVCRHPSFNFGFFTDFFADDLHREGLPRDTTAYVALLEHGVFSVGPFADPAAARALDSLLSSLDIPHAAAAEGNPE